MNTKDEWFRGTMMIPADLEMFSPVFTTAEGLRVEDMSGKVLGSTWGEEEGSNSLMVNIDMYNTIQ